MVVFVFVFVFVVVFGATENTYTPARQEALFKLSVVLILSHLVRSIRTARTIQIFQFC